MNQILAIDPEFEAKCPPLTEEEFQQLEENILEEGLVLMPLIVWNNTIIDGHNRYRIAMAHPGVEFRTHEKMFDNRFEAISWICKNQLGRRNLTAQQKKYLIGQRYAAEKNMNGGDRKSEDAKSVVQNEPLISPHITRAQIAEDTNTSESYVMRADWYAKGVDAAEEVLPGIKGDLLSGTVKPRDSDVVAIARASPEERLEKAKKLREPREKLPVNHHKKEFQEIDEIYTEMKDQSKTVGEDDVLETLRAAVKTMIRVCNTLFEDFPRLLTDSPYKAKVIDIMQEPKTYIQRIEGETK